MTTPGQNLPTATGDREEVSDTVRDSTTSPVDRTNAAPTPPQHPTSTHHQPLPQPFHSQNQPVYIPYTGQPNQQFPYSTPIRPLPHLSSAWLATRIALTSLSTIWGIVIVALTSVLVSRGGTAAAVAFYSYVIVAVSILWNAAELITYFVRLRKQVQRGIHPGAHVGLHLLFWIAGVFASLLTISVYLGVASVLQQCEHEDDEDNNHYYYDDYCDEYKPFNNYRDNVLSVVRALFVIFVIWSVNHFVLFVLACIETHKRNSLRSAAFVMPPQPLNTLPVQGMQYPAPVAGTQPMQPVQYYPYPVMMQAPPMHMMGPESRTQATTEKQPAQAYQNIAGFYAPASGPPAGTSSNNANTSSSAQNTEQA
ncbi:hypothetical protein F5Y12DRAFT_6464 [Xylaria sp. FL1777]|nr:hypothetical protein F5Y12DRAFT_6464 [Xylaria sp. FL1777]